MIDHPTHLHPRTGILLPLPLLRVVFLLVAAQHARRDRLEVAVGAGEGPIPCVDALVFPEKWQYQCILTRNIQYLASSLQGDPGV